MGPLGIAMGPLGIAMGAMGPLGSAMGPLIFINHGTPRHRHGIYGHLSTHTYITSTMRITHASFAMAGLPRSQ